MIQWKPTFPYQFIEDLTLLNLLNELGKRETNVSLADASKSHRRLTGTIYQKDN